MVVLFVFCWNIVRIMFNYFLRAGLLRVLFEHCSKKVNYPPVPIIIAVGFSDEPVIWSRGKGGFQTSLV
ncbi:MAG: hypothetical protein QW831_09470 [Candidatus Jordarchaeaceae archaeon]